MEQVAGISVRNKLKRIALLGHVDQDPIWLASRSGRTSLHFSIVSYEKKTGPGAHYGRDHSIKLVLPVDSPLANKIRRGQVVHLMGWAKVTVYLDGRKTKRYCEEFIIKTLDVLALG